MKKDHSHVDAVQLAQALDFATTLVFGAMVKATMPKFDVVVLERKNPDEKSSKKVKQ